MSYLVANPEDRVSRDEALIVFQKSLNESLIPNFNCPVYP